MYLIRAVLWHAVISKLSPGPLRLDSIPFLGGDRGWAAGDVRHALAPPCTPESSVHLPPSPAQARPTPPGKAPAVCQPCPLVSLLPQPLLVILGIPPAPLVRMCSRDFGVTVSNRARLSRQGSRKGEGPRLRYLPNDDDVIWGGRNMLPLPPVSVHGQSKYHHFKTLRKPGEDKTTRRNLH